MLGSIDTAPFKQDPYVDPQMIRIWDLTNIKTVLQSHN